MIHDLQSEVSGDYGKALIILAEVLKAFMSAATDLSEDNKNLIKRKRTTETERKTDTKPPK